MKRVPVFFLVACVAPVWARYEEELGVDGPGELAPINLAIYMLIGVALWAALTWDRGWRWRVWPLLYLAAMVVLGLMYGQEGIGGLLMGTFIAAFPLGMWQPWRKRD